MNAYLKSCGYVYDNNLNGHYTYGPLGKGLKNRIEDFFRKRFNSLEFSEVETPLIYKKEVWEYTGHWDKFHDPIIYTHNGLCHRIDKLLESNFGLVYEDLTIEEIKEYLNKLNETLDDKLLIKNEIETRNLMMETYSGSNHCGMRPETASGTFHSFNDFYNYQNKQYPVKVYQIGKSFRNEVSSRNSIIRCKEFTQAEFQLITKDSKYNLHYNKTEFIVNTKIDPKNVWDLGITNEAYNYLVMFTYECFQDLGIPKDRIRLRQHGEKELAFYANDAWDIEIKLNEHGWTEICGIHDRGVYDLRNHSEQPSILEIAIGIDRLFYSILDSLYANKDISEGKKILNIPYFLSPIQLSVLPLVKNKPDIVNLAKSVHRDLLKTFIVEYDEKSTVGKRYLRNAIRGIPYTITIDFQSLEDSTVTVRDRDTEDQVRVDIDKLKEYFLIKQLKF
jgi:glycyl-tRNA synthetase